MSTGGEASSQTRIVLAEDHGVVREGLRSLLESQRDLSVVGETGDGIEAVALVEQLDPDVLVVDIAMPSLNGLEVTRKVGRVCPRTRVVVLSMYSNETYVLEALRGGAFAYVLKGSSAAELVQAIREVAAGRRFLSPPLDQMALAAYAQGGDQAVREPYDELTEREREVFQLAAEGYANGEIAARLFISPRTVENHRAHLMRKLGLRNQTGLVRYAIERGVLPEGLVRKS